ncbi:MAG TPA: response regulator [Pyrinomonadaceae bacterium]|nr:response regulator [Pyrinomonadaceae bacterium]
MPSPPVVMVVDDDEDIRFLITRLMRNEGYEVLEAATATEAKLATLKKTPELILMDISMPDADGLSAIWDLREQNETAHVPVVIVSAFDAFDLRAEATAAGCAGYLTKPVDIEELKRLVRRILENPGDACA